MNKSFTLIEILVVIVVIGILSSFILFGMSSITDKANIAKSQAFLNSMDNSLLLSRVSEWKLDDSSGNDSWNGRTATLVNTPTLTLNCPQGSCYTFNGSNQYAWIADNDDYFNFGSQMSAFVWIKGGAQAGYKSYFSQYEYTLNKRSWWMGNSGSPYNKIQIMFSDNGTENSGHIKTYISSNAYLDNNWHLIGFTWSNGVFLMYVDGQSVSYTSTGTLTSSTFYNSDTNITIGCYMNNGSYWQYFNGQIDDVRLYNQPIPTSEIQQNYYSGLNNLIVKGELNNKEYGQRLQELVINN